MTVPQVHVLCTKGGRGPPREREREEENEIVDYTVEVPTREREEKLREVDPFGHLEREQEHVCIIVCSVREDGS